MALVRTGVVVRTMAACAVLGLGGCVTAKKYRMAKADTPPSRPLDWSISAPPADLTLTTVIVFKGPGSWKREARWDEYVVKLTNHGGQPMHIDSVELIDVLGQPQLAWADPWQLEKLSYTNWDKYGKTGLKLLAGAGAVTLYGAVVAGAAYTSIMAGGAAAGGGAAVLSIIPVVAIVDITAVVIMNNQNRKKVVAEFNRRRLVLPLTVAPGASVEGSYFFPMTPSPQRLVQRGRSGDSPIEFTLDLKPLADLHLKPAAEKATTPP